LGGWGRIRKLAEQTKTAPVTGQNVGEPRRGKDKEELRGNVVGNPIVRVFQTDRGGRTALGGGGT